MGKVLYPTRDNSKGELIEYDDRYSNKDYTSGKLYSEKNLKNLVIYNSCFSKEKPDNKVFPSDMTGVVFYNCNLDNCILPSGNTIIGGVNKRFCIQTDRNYWLINEGGLPIEPLNKKEYIKLGLSIDPKDLPVEIMPVNIIELTQQALNVVEEGI